MPFCKLYYHLVWATKGRLPLLSPDVEPVVHSAEMNLSATLLSLDESSLEMPGA